MSPDMEFDNEIRTVKLIKTCHQYSIMGRSFPSLSPDIARSDYAAPHPSPGPSDHVSALAGGMERPSDRRAVRGLLPDGLSLAPAIPARRRRGGDAGVSPVGGRPHAARGCEGRHRRPPRAPHLGGRVHPNATPRNRLGAAGPLGAGAAPVVCAGRPLPGAGGPAAESQGTASSHAPRGLADGC
jgi:hypothetical protein